MEIDLLLVPYDSARRGERMGAGPEALVAAGLPALLERQGHRVRRIVVEPPDDGWMAEIRTAFDLAAAIALRVREARASGRFPLVLAGNCSASLGVCAGLGADVEVLWADAHGDFNTPETTVGGFLDGMALATLAGRCWTKLASRIPGFAPIAEARIRLLGARDLDPLEAGALDGSAVRRIPAREVDAGLAARIAPMLHAGSPLYLHLDLDVLDPDDGRVNSYAAPGGVGADALASFCSSLRQHAPPAALTLSAYDPAADSDGRARGVAMRIVEALFAPAVPTASAPA